MERQFLRCRVAGINPLAPRHEDAACLCIPCVSLLSHNDSRLAEDPASAVLSACVFSRGRTT
ncbi:unnamed protein product [Fusarium graminearum]|nr:unnamed protein product [Fusarium graminearum]CAG1972261.1 unnamed protein product [Fusarium graminearum]CAG1979379.1 unnamed protein product [Fusarium graminearum]VTO94484.1 unnamed protein product [Fusarium graminearum]